MKMKKKVENVVAVIWAMAWLLSLAAMDITVSVVNEMRATLGEDGEPISILAFLWLMALSVVIIGFTGMLIAVLKVN